MIKSVNQLRQELEEISTTHLQINSFYWGDFLVAYKQNRLNYPLMGSFYPSASFDRNQSSILLTIYVADKLYKDWSNLNEVESDTLQICRDIFQVIRSSTRWQSFGKVVGAPNITKFVNRGGDEVAGHQMQFTFTMRDRDGVCGLPMEDYDFDQVTGVLCAPVSIYQDGVLIATVPSGSSYTVVSPDGTVEITDSENNLLHTVTVESGGTETQPIGDSTYTVEYENGTLIEIGSILAEGSVVVQVPDPIVCANTDIEVNGVSEGSVTAGATVNVTLEDSLGNPLTPSNVTQVGNDFEVSINTHWQRNPDWLPLPKVNVGDNRFVGLYAVFESGLGSNTVEITITTAGTNTIDWGDGNSQAMLNGSNTHVYDYATLGGAVITDIDGRNYKMVIIDMSVVGVIGIDLISNTLHLKGCASGWLDIITSATSLNSIFLSSESTTTRIGLYCERFLLIDNSILSGNNVNAFFGLKRLRIFKNDNLLNASNKTSALSYTGDIRDVNGHPLNFTFNSGVFNNILKDSLISEIDTISSNIVSSYATLLQNCIALNKINLIDIPNATSILGIVDNNQSLNAITLNVGISLTDISFAFRNCYSLSEIIFTGDLSNVTNTNNTFQLQLLPIILPSKLQRLILPNLTRGFDIRASQVTGQNLQDLFTSLGTASGAQTITLPTFTNTEPTAIATGKGYTIAYA